jgi:hypothetical protein
MDFKHGLFTESKKKQDSFCYAFISLKFRYIETILTPQFIGVDTVMLQDCRQS